MFPNSNGGCNEVLTTRSNLVMVFQNTIMFPVTVIPDKNHCKPRHSGRHLSWCDRYSESRLNPFRAMNISALLDCSLYKAMTASAKAEILALHACDCHRYLNRPNWRLPQHEQGDCRFRLLFVVFYSVADQAVWYQTVQLDIWLLWTNSTALVLQAVTEHTGFRGWWQWHVITLWQLKVRQSALRKMRGQRTDKGRPIILEFRSSWSDRVSRDQGIVRPSS